jgi:ribosomal protein L7/L12
MARKDEEIYALRQKVRKLEHRVAFLLDHLGLDYPEESDPGITEEIIELVRMGRKIEAIRLYREATGVGLKEAKEFIDSL